MLGKVRAGQNHSLWSVNTAMLRSRNAERLLSLAAIPAGFSPLPELSRGYLVPDGKPGEAAELLTNSRPRTDQFRTICTNAVSSFRALVFSG